MTPRLTLAGSQHLARHSPLFKFIFDLTLWAISAPVAFSLRLERVSPAYLPAILIYGGLGAILKAGLILSAGIHRQSWRQVGVRDLYALLRVIGLGMVVLLAMSFIVRPYVEDLPRSIPLIDGLVGLILLGGTRLAFRMLHEQVRSRAAGRSARRVLIVGAGEAGTMMAREMLRHPESGLQPIGFLDDDPAKWRQSILGVRVYGPIRNLHQVVTRLKPDEALIVMPSAPGQVVRQVVELARQAGVKHRIFPGVYDILSGKVSLSDIREVDVEDLLRRQPVRLNMAEVGDYLQGRVVLVTGAGGSIGSEIVRQVAHFNPAQLILVGRGENSLYQIKSELQREWPRLDSRPVIADIQSRDKVRLIFTRYRPGVVFHAAAHKHVPLMEMNPDEAILNNVGGTRNLLEAALECGVEHFVNLSTDKAVNPVSIMGASKQVAEILVAWAAYRAEPGQAFVSVRFGNVLGSRGSVIPLFKEQIRSRGPVTVTHPEMTRYFMTIPEATQLVLQAGSFGQNGIVYVLDMGEPVRIVDLAYDLIRLYGYEPEVDVPIVFTGIRPGEKLSEELTAADETIETSRHSKILMARKNGICAERLLPLVDALLEAAQQHDEARIRTLLGELVPGYRPVAVLSIAQL